MNFPSGWTAKLELLEWTYNQSINLTGNSRVLKSSSALAGRLFHRCVSVRGKAVLFLQSFMASVYESSKIDPLSRSVFSGVRNVFVERYLS